MTLAMPLGQGAVLSSERLWRRDLTRYPISPSARRLDQQPNSSSTPANESWLTQATSRLEQLGALTYGWDGLDGLPIKPACIEAVAQFISSDVVLKVETKPDIVPTSDGGLQVEWHSQLIDLIIEVDPNIESSYYLSDLTTGIEQEGSLHEATDTLATAFVALGYQF